MRGTAEPGVRRHCYVSGRVQGVGFRASCRREAVARGTSGFVRNLADGRVEAAFEGAQGAVEELVAWCRLGPPGASVAEVVVLEEELQGGEGFLVVG